MDKWKKQIDRWIERRDEFHWIVPKKRMDQLRKENEPVDNTNRSVSSTFEPNDDLSLMKNNLTRFHFPSMFLQWREKKWDFTSDEWNDGWNRTS